MPASNQSLRVILRILLKISASYASSPQYPIIVDQYSEIASKPVSPSISSRLGLLHVL
ncbi:MAG: hypothetical protein QXE10_03680 [Desulfurococcaceae archaeon]